MAVSMALARKLCTAQEWTLVEASRGPALKALSPAKLKAKVSRARTLRDKYRGLAKRQAGEARGKRKARGARPAQSNQNTERKAQLFAEALERFQAQLEAAERAAAKAARAKAAGATAKAVKAKAKAAKAKSGVARAARREAVATLSGRARSSAARSARKANRIEASGKARIRGHVGARGRRRQSRRDSR